MVFVHGLGHSSAETVDVVASAMGPRRCVENVRATSKSVNGVGAVVCDQLQSSARQTERRHTVRMVLRLNAVRSGSLVLQDIHTTPGQELVGLGPPRAATRSVGQRFQEQHNYCYSAYTN